MHDSQAQSSLAKAASSGPRKQHHQPEFIGLNIESEVSSIPDWSTDWRVSTCGCRIRRRRRRSRRNIRRRNRRMVIVLKQLYTYHTLTLRMGWGCRPPPRIDLSADCQEVLKVETASPTGMNTNRRDYVRVRAIMSSRLSKSWIWHFENSRFRAYGLGRKNDRERNKTLMKETFN